MKRVQRGAARAEKARWVKRNGGWLTAADVSAALDARDATIAKLQSELEQTKGQLWSMTNAHNALLREFGKLEGTLKARNEQGLDRELVHAFFKAVSAFGPRRSDDE